MVCVYIFSRGITINMHYNLLVKIGRHFLLTFLSGCRSISSLFCHCFLVFVSVLLLSVLRYNNDESKRILKGRDIQTRVEAATIERNREREREREGKKR